MYLQMQFRGSRKLWEGKTVRAEVIMNVLKPGEDCWAEGTRSTVVSPLGQNDL